MPTYTINLGYEELVAYSSTHGPKSHGQGGGVGFAYLGFTQVNVMVARIGYPIHPSAHPPSSTGTLLVH